MPTDNDIFPQIIVQVATHYWGDPNHSLSSPNELRFGNHGSKSVNVQKGAWYDFEANIGGGVVELIRHEEPNVSIPDRLSAFGVAPSKSAKKQQKIYDYRDKTGKTIYQIVRIDTPAGKNYRQRSISDDGTIIWNMHGVTPIPYRLPELHASEAPVFIVEGEKCADALSNIDLTATTNHGGAGKWWSTLTQHFQGRDVIIIPDNDSPGYKHAAIVAAALNGVANTIKIITLPDQREKDDVFDWIAKGGTKQALLELVDAASLYSSDQNPTLDSPAETISILGWDGLQDKQIDWLIDGILPANAFVALYGRPGSFKSFVALYIATMIGSGNLAFGRKCLQGDVVYIVGEGGAGIKNRVGAIKKNYGIESARVYFILQQLNLRSTDQDRQNIVSAIKAKNIDPYLIIIDTLARAFGGGNENSSEDMGAFIGQIGRLQEELNAAVMIVHHSGKDETRGQRGHSSLLGAVDTELEAAKISGPDDASRIGQITVTKQKDGEDGVRIGYRMDVVHLGLVDASKSSLALVPMDIGEMPVKTKKKGLTPQQKIALKALEQAIEKDGKVVSLPNIPPDTCCVELKFWRSMFNAMFVGEKDAQRVAFKRCSEALQESRTIGFWDDLVWISSG